MTTRDQLTRIAARHGIPLPGTLPVPWTGATSHVWPLGEVVVKIPFEEPGAIAALRTDAAIAPLARGLGVSAPELIAVDDRRDIVPVPYALFRRVADAAPLDRTDRSDRVPATWATVGRQLARVHTVRTPGAVPIELRTFRQSPEVDPRPWVDALLAGDQMTTTDARWLRDLLDRLAPAALAEAPVALCHGDVNAANVLVDACSGTFRALIDWAGAGWLDPVWDFAGVPLDVVPWMLTGHREVAPLPADETAEARILWCQVQTRLHAARTAPRGDSTRVDIDQVRRYAETARLP